MTFYYSYCISLICGPISFMYSASNDTSFVNSLYVNESLSTTEIFACLLRNIWFFNNACQISTLAFCTDFDVCKRPKEVTANVDNGRKYLIA